MHIDYACIYTWYVHIYVRACMHAYLPGTYMPYIATRQAIWLWGVQTFDTGANIHATRDWAKRTCAMITPRHDSMITSEHGVYLIMGPTFGLFNRENIPPSLQWPKIKWIDGVCAHLYGPWLAMPGIISNFLGRKRKETRADLGLKGGESRLGGLWWSRVMLGGTIG